jgi:hypothetical protein
MEKMLYARNVRIEFVEQNFARARAQNSSMATQQLEISESFAMKKCASSFCSSL